MSSHGWAAARGIRSTWKQFRSAWTQLPHAAVRRWAWALAIGTLLTGGLSAGMTAIARQLVRNGLQRWDHALLERIATLKWFSFQQAVWWEAYGASSVLIPATALATVIAVRSGRPLLAATWMAGYLLAKPIVFAGWGTWSRARPELIAGGAAAPPLNSFPSGHAMQAAAIYGLMVFLWIRHSSSRLERLVAVLTWTLLLALVCLARLRLGVHWPSDVVGGALVGTAWLATLIVALRRAQAAGGR